MGKGGAQIRRRCVATLVALVALSFAPARVLLALDYPTRPITIIVPFAAGGILDIHARLLAKGLAERAGQPVVVDNRPGAAGSIGTRLAARAAPDGHTVLLGALYLAVEPVLRGDVGYDPVRDFAPVTLVGQAPFLLAVPFSSPDKNLGDLLVRARQHPGMTFGTPGPGTAPDLLGEMLRVSAHVDLLHVPYKGEAPAIVDLVGGQISMAFISPFAGLPQLRGKKLRALAVTASSRLDALPDVPTFAEAGFPTLNLQFWSGMLVPIATPKEVVVRLHALVASVLRSPEFIHAIESSGGVVLGGSPEEMRQRLQADSAAVVLYAQTSHIKLEE